MRRFNLFLKRLMDIVGSGIGLLVLSPLLLLIAVMIKATSKGPVFFKQERIGRYGTVFHIIKFRTMVLDAEHMGDGLRVRTGSDPRITNIGRFLRAASLDELPQLINSLCGSMSLVGPRPPVTYHPYDSYSSYPDWAKKRFEMRPGITGLAQVTVRNAVPWNDRIVVDNRYIDHFNIWLDIKILFMTVTRVVRRQNIYANKLDKASKKAETIVRKG